MQEVNENISQASAVNKNVAESIDRIRVNMDVIVNHCLEMREYSAESKRLSKSMLESCQHVNVGPNKFDIGLVKTAHLNWKIQLEAVLEGRKKMAAENVVDHHNCDLGKWYDNAHGEITNNSVFKNIAIHHKAVHSTAKEVVSLFNQNNQSAAHNKLTDFEASRKELFRLLDELYSS